jgi:hypothetical protein
LGGIRGIGQWRVKIEGKPYDDANTFNSLTEFSGDITKMLAALRSLIERIDGTEVNVFTEK